jgi:hypothetical protein
MKGPCDPILLTEGASHLRTSLLAGDAVQIQFAMLGLWTRLHDCGQLGTGWPRLLKRWHSWWRSVSYSLLLPPWM